MGDVEVRAWRRFGQFRLYVSEAEEKIGWYDARTGAHHLDRPDRAEAFWLAVRDECDRLAAAGTEIPSPPLPETSTPGPAEPGATAPSDSAPPEPDIDLGLNRPGAAASAHAARLRAERPVRTRLSHLFGVRTQARDFAVGAKAERAVGRKLDRWASRHGWHVLHAVPVGRNGADIDHVLFGPFGVVTINTKKTKGKVWAAPQGMVVGGTKVDYLRNSRFEAKRTRALLSQALGRHVPVHSAIVFVGATRLTLRDGGPNDVAVLPNTRALRRWLRRRGKVLPPGELPALYELARRPTTWQV